MHPQIPAEVRPPHAQLLSTSTSTEMPTPPHLNALKHGLYSRAILLPGDDVAEFQRQRQALFHTYRPQTEDEAELVETLAESRWLRQRCRPVQARFDAHMIAPAVDAAGRLCEPVGHQRLHSSMDVTVHRQRIERMGHRARAKLVELQKLRRLGLIEGAVRLPAHCYMDSSGAVMGPVVNPFLEPIPAPAVAVQQAEVPLSHRQPGVAVGAGTLALGTNGSGDGEIGKNQERKENLGQLVLPGGVARPMGPGLGAFVRAEVRPLELPPNFRLRERAPLAWSAVSSG